MKKQQPDQEISTALLNANKELALLNKEKTKRATELIIANIELDFQNKEKEKREAESIIAKIELVFQNKEKEKREAELVITYRELEFQKEEREKRASELVIANIELHFQNEEKEKRAIELIISKKEIAFQNEEREKRAAELVIANKELVFQNEEKEKRAAELVIANKELALSNAELEQFAHAASHDLQEPLRMVSSFMGLLERGLEGQLNELHKEYLYFAVDGAERMKLLIQALLQYSKVGTNKETFTATNLNEVMEYCTRVLEEDIRKIGAVITVDALPVISANKALITQLFINLIGNALKYHGDKEPAIAVGFTEEKDKYIFHVRDNGIGIDPAFFDKIFIIFQRLHTKTEYSGTGIGLAICKKIVEIHKGKIWVESTRGEGSTFYFSIPKIPCEHR